MRGLGAPGSHATEGASTGRIFHLGGGDAKINERWPDASWPSRVRALLASRCDLRGHTNIRRAKSARVGGQSEASRASFVKNGLWRLWTCPPCAAHDTPCERFALAARGESLRDRSHQRSRSSAWRVTKPPSATAAAESRESPMTCAWTPDRSTAAYFRLLLLARDRRGVVGRGVVQLQRARSCTHATASPPPADASRAPGSQSRPSKYTAVSAPGTARRKYRPGATLDAGPGPARRTSGRIAPRQTHSSTDPVGLQPPIKRMRRARRGRSLAGSTSTLADEASGRLYHAVYLWRLWTVRCRGESFNSRNERFHHGLLGHPRPTHHSVPAGGRSWPDGIGYPQGFEQGFEDHITASCPP